ncbi:cytochrome P450 ClCP1 [Dactylonectria macrodidyma]|uniref:Cytochrome P450 ClCP1 n=1 Tax=Dactylonectria macrodidyma TaxID=307937 RepID=A0A9P9E2E1_9HYPO|nr:cytochrome P450 ClCP1 [Dactylonectria macrodidyma]
MKGLCIHVDLFIQQIVSKNTLAKVKEHRRLTDEKVLKRIELQNSLHRDDLFAHLLRNDDISEDEMKSQAMTLTGAGSETTETSLTAITYFLLRNPKAFKPLALEVRSSFDSVDNITRDDTNALPYLRAVLEEGLRIFPPASFGLPRISPGTMVDGLFIPLGVVVSVPPSVTHRDPQYREEPESFKPERWLLNEVGASKGAFQPFSLGPCACIGVNLACLEMRIILVKLVWMYDWELVNQDLNFLNEVRLYFIWEKPSVFVRFHPIIDT